MVYASDSLLDDGLQYAATNGDRVDICSQEPATYTEATSTYSLGNKTSASVGNPTDRSPNGRKVTIAAITDGSVTSSDTATHWALSKTTATTELLASDALSSSQAVTNGNTWTLPATDIGAPDPT